MSKPLKLLRFGSLTIIMLLTQSCVEFAEQSTTFVYDGQTDTLRMVQVYHGIFGGEKNARLTAKERDQFERVMAEEKTFFYANWIFEYSASAARNAIQDMRKEDDKKDEYEAAMHAAGAAMYESLLENVRVRTGGFYKDEKGRLCGWQTVTIKETTEVLKLANPAISKLVLDSFKDGDPEWSDASVALLNEAASGDYEWLSVGSNWLQFQMPMSAEDYRRIRRDLASPKNEAAKLPKTHHVPKLRVKLAGILPIEIDMEAEEYGEMQHWLHRLEGMIASDMDLWWADNTMQVRIGLGDDAPAHFSMPVFAGYVDNGSKDVERLYDIDATLDIDAKTKEFLDQK
jgi:hypothetical protein